MLLTKERHFLEKKFFKSLFLFISSCLIFFNFHTECIRDLDWTLVKNQDDFLCHFWPLLMWATIYGAPRSLPEIDSRLTPTNHNKVRLVQIPDPHCKFHVFIHQSKVTNKTGFGPVSWQQQDNLSFFHKLK